MEEIRITKMGRNFQIVGPMSTTGEVWGPLGESSFASERLLEIRLQAYGFTRNEIDGSINELRKSGNVVLIYVRRTDEPDQRTPPRQI